MLTKMIKNNRNHLVGQLLFEHKMVLLYTMLCLFISNSGGTKSQKYSWTLYATMLYLYLK